MFADLPLTGGAALQAPARRRVDDVTRSERGVVEGAISKVLQQSARDRKQPAAAAEQKSQHTRMVTLAYADRMLTVARPSPRVSAAAPAAAPKPPARPRVVVVRPPNGAVPGGGGGAARKTFVRSADAAPLPGEPPKRKLKVRSPAAAQSEVW